jgi:hypothetical protein
MAESKKVRVLELTVWLGASQKVRINACDTLGGNPSVDPDYSRSGFPSNVSGADLIELVDEILTKLKQAYPNKEPIQLCVEDDEIVAC